MTNTPSRVLLKHKTRAHKSSHTKRFFRARFWETLQKNLDDLNYSSQPQEGLRLLGPELEGPRHPARFSPIQRTAAGEAVH